MRGETSISPPPSTFGPPRRFPPFARGVNGPRIPRRQGEGGGEGCDRVQLGRSLDPRGGAKGVCSRPGVPIRGSGWGVAGGGGLVLVIVITPPILWQTCLPGPFLILEGGLRQMHDMTKSENLDLFQPNTILH